MQTCLCGIAATAVKEAERCSVPRRAWAGKCQLTNQNLVCILITATRPSLTAVTVALTINTDVIIEVSNLLQSDFIFTM